MFMHAARRSPLRLPRPATCLALVCTLSAGSLLAQVTPWQTQIVASPDAQTLPEDRGADGLAQTLRKLHTWASLMTIVAHPDDEDGGLLTLESRGLGARTALLTLTRGEGGQNAMSSEADDALGLIRTNELLLADQYSGTEQFFSRVADYGFSKTIDEAHEKWGRDRVLYDAVRAVRMYRPLVVTSVFVGGITDGHGHHQVAGEAAQEVYKLAGDPSVFPDQIAEGLLPWKPLKIYERLPFFSITQQGMFDYATNKWAPVRFYNYITGEWSDKAPSADVQIPEGTYDPILGRSYFQIAREGWSNQKSQYGGGNYPLPGPVSVAYHRYASDVPVSDHETNIFDGIDTSLPGMAILAHGDATFLKTALSKIDQHVITATFGYLPSDPSKIMPELAAGYRETLSLIEAIKDSSLSATDKANINHELQIKVTQFNTAIAEALGLQVNAFVIPRTADRPDALSNTAADTPIAVTPSSEFDVRLHVTSAGPWSTGGPLKLTKTWLAPSDPTPWTMQRLGSPGMDSVWSNAGDVIYRVTVPHNARVTRPYFSRPNTEQAYYDLSDPKLANQPLAPYPLAGWAEFTYDGLPIRIGQVVQTVHREHGFGSLYQPLVVLPKISVGFSSNAGVVALGATAFPLTVTVKNEQAEKDDATLHLELPSGWTSDPPTTSLHLRPGEAIPTTFTVHPATVNTSSVPIKAIAQSGNDLFNEGIQQVGYPGVRPYFLYRPASYEVRGVDVKVDPKLNIGYIMGTGDGMPQALEEIGLHPHLLTTGEISGSDLSRYNAIIIGIRAYSNRPELRANTQRLMEYVRQGGSLIVQYQSVGFGSQDAPYSLSLGGNPEKVVEENDPVTLTDHALFQWPNRITPADFNGWVEERGHSFLDSWDSHYSPLAETHDPGQDPQRGGLLYTRLGKGNYIYVAYALYRQVPEGVPGAFRILANLVSIGVNPHLSTPAPDSH